MAKREHGSSTAVGKRAGQSTAVKKAGPRQRAVIGWREWVGLPELGVDRIKAKIDTGARTSAIHAFEIRPFERNGRRYVSFLLHPVQHRRQPEVRCEAPVVDERVVTSSNGERQERYVIQTVVKLGDAAWSIEATLTNRDEMGFRMLLGRGALRRRFVVDPGGSFRLSGNPSSGKGPRNPAVKKKSYKVKTKARSE